MFACVVAVLTGCGAKDDESPSEAITTSDFPRIVSRAEFVDKAKAICDKASEGREDDVSAFYERRSEETGESLGVVGAVEAIPEVIVPSLRRELNELESVGLPRGEAYEAEAIWQTLRTVLVEVEVEGIYAWRSAKLLPPFRNRATPFGLQYCVVN
jgi:hypothetical protein